MWVSPTPPCAPYAWSPGLCWFDHKIFPLRLLHAKNRYLPVRKFLRYVAENFTQFSRPCISEFSYFAGHFHVVYDHVQPSYTLCDFVNYIYATNVNGVVGSDPVADFSQLLGIDAEEIKNKVLSQLLLDKSSPLRTTYEEQLVKRVRRSVNQISDKKNFIKVPYCLTIDEETRLQSSFREFKIEFTNKCVHSHAFAAASRACELELILSMARYSTKSSFEDYTHSIIDVGGNWFTHFSRKRFNIHSCCPIITYYDDLRESTRRYQFSTGEFHHPDYAEPRRRIIADDGHLKCSRLAQDCPCTAPVGIFLHSLYDIQLHDLATILTRKRIKVAYCSIIFSPKILLPDKEGFLHENGCHYVKDYDQDTITFSFTNDSSLNYRHRLSSYLNLMRHSVISDGINRYYVQLLTNRNGVQFLSLTAATDKVTLSREPLTHKLWFEAWEKTTVIETYDWNLHFDDEHFSLPPEQRRRMLKRRRILAPTSFVDKLTQFALRYSETKFTVGEVYNMAVSLNSRRVVNGVSVIAPYEIPATDLYAIANAVYITAFIMKYDAGQITHSVIDDIRSTRTIMTQGVCADVVALIGATTRRFFSFLKVAAKRPNDMSPLEDSVLQLLHAVSSKDHYIVSIRDMVKYVEFDSYVHECYSMVDEAYVGDRTVSRRTTPAVHETSLVPDYTSHKPTEHHSFNTMTIGCINNTRPDVDDIPEIVAEAVGSYTDTLPDTNPFCTRDSRKPDTDLAKFDEFVIRTISKSKPPNHEHTASTASGTPADHDATTESTLEVAGDTPTPACAEVDTTSPDIVEFPVAPMLTTFDITVTPACKCTAELVRGTASGDRNMCLYDSLSQLPYFHRDKHDVKAQVLEFAEKTAIPGFSRDDAIHCLTTDDQATDNVIAYAAACYDTAICVHIHDGNNTTEVLYGQFEDVVHIRLERNHFEPLHQPEHTTYTCAVRDASDASSHVATDFGHCPDNFLPSSGKTVHATSCVVPHYTVPTAYVCAVGRVFAHQDVIDQADTVVYSTPDEFFDNFEDPTDAYTLSFVVGDDVTVSQARRLLDFVHILCANDRSYVFAYSGFDADVYRSPPRPVVEDNTITYSWQYSRVVIKDDDSKYLPDVGSDYMLYNAFLEYRYINATTADLLNHNLACVLREFDDYECGKSMRHSHICLMRDSRNIGIYDTRGGRWIVRPKTNTTHTHCFDGDSIVRIPPDGLSTLKTKNGRAVVTTETSVYLLDRYADAFDDILKLRNGRVLPDLHFVQGPPGCGKTQYIVDHFHDGDFAVTTTRSAKEDLARRLASKSVATSASFIVNRRKYPDTISTLWIDESLMLHPGEIYALLVTSNCERCVALGDFKQIPYVNRVPLVPSRYTQLGKIVPAAEVLTTTHRCPKDVTFILSGIYGDITTTSSVSMSLALTTIRADTDVPVIDNDDTHYLTFKQSDKDTLITRLRVPKNRVNTIHEFQGQKAKDIIVVRFSNKPTESIFLREPWVIVAISRHTRSLNYYTYCSSDTLSRFIQTPVTQENINSVTLVRGGLSYTTVPVYLSPVDNAYGQNDVFDGLSRSNLFPNVSNLYPRTHVNEYIFSSFERLDHLYTPSSATVSVDSARVLQSYYDVIFPGNSTHVNDNDQYINETCPTDLVVQDVRFNVAKGHYKYPRYDTLRPQLRTSIGRARQSTQLESLLAMIKRNLNVPELADIVCPTDTATLMFDRFVSSAIDPARVDVFEGFSNNVIEFNQYLFESWAKTQKASTMSNIENVDLDNIRMDTYEFLLKRNPKPTLTSAAPFEYSSLQTIACHPKTVNAIFSPIFRQLKERLLKVLAKNVLLNTDVSPVEFETILNSRFDPAVFDGLRKLEIDISKYDKSQGESTLMFERMLYIKLGLDERLADLWYACHRASLLKDYSNGISAVVSFQRKSGDAATYFGNTVVLLGVVASLFDLRDIHMALFSGDDSLLASTHDFTDPSLLCASLFNLETKAYRYKYAYFCSKFVVSDGNSFHFVPDVAKTLSKLGRKDLVNAEHCHEFATSFRDLLQSYKRHNLYPILSEAFAERYSVRFDVTHLLTTIADIVEDPTTLQRSLFYSCRNDVHTSSALRPTLDM